MYIVIVTLAILLFALLLLNYFRKKHILQRVAEMSFADKSCLLNNLAAPFGCSYLSVQDIFTPGADTLKKNPDDGYREFYEQPAPTLNSVLDSEPVYFNYQGKTWLIVFWKGQYGIHMGAEAGIYHADRIMPPALRPQTVFQAVLAENAFPIKMRLIGPDCPFFSVTGQKQRIGGFVTGVCLNPGDLLLEVSITFPDTEMCSAFTRAMNGLGYQSSKLLVYQTTVQFYFTTPKAVPLVPPDIFLRNYVLNKNRFFCTLFLWMTEPFFTALDRLIYLHYAYPCLFRRALKVKRNQKRRRRTL